MKNLLRPLKIRTLLPSFFAGLSAAVLLSGLPYLFDRQGDSHIGYWIYVFSFAALFGCHVLGVVSMFGALKCRQSWSRRIMTLPVAFLVILASYLLAFVFIVRLAFGFWVWEASTALFIPCLIVGVISAGVFVLSSRIHAA